METQMSTATTHVSYLSLGVIVLDVQTIVWSIPLTVEPE